MGVLDFFRRKGLMITAENVEAKARELAIKISAKEATIAEMRAELPGQVLEGDNLAAHRIEAELRIVNALKVAREELEAKARELRVFEKFSEEISRFEGAAEKGRKCLPLAKALIAAIIPIGAAARALRAANAEFIGSMESVPYSRLNLGQNPLLSDDLDRLVVLALEDPDALEGAIAQIIDLCEANADSLRARRDSHDDEPKNNSSIQIEVNGGQANGDY